VPLETLDERHRRTAVGYVELGMYLEADAELDKIDPFCRAAPEVLAVRLGIYAGLQKCELMQVVAEKVANYDPTEAQWRISFAYATRRTESIEKAREILLTALGSHPEEPAIHYNLACYECQLANLSAAKQHLTKATKTGGKFKLMALEAPDLEPLWPRSNRHQITATNVASFSDAGAAP
jgi:tetratricopeptide (TPR) repeat protein